MSNFKKNSKWQKSTMQIDPEVHQKMKDLAVKTGKNLNELYREAALDLVAKHQEKK